MIKKIICLVLCVVLLATPALATPISSGSFSSIIVYGLTSDGSGATFNDSGNYIVVDSIEFLDQVVTALQLNVAWQRHTTIVPYFVGRCTILGSGTYRGIFVRRELFHITTATQGDILINGRYYDASQNHYFPINGSDLFFDYTFSLSQNSSYYYLYADARVENNSTAIILCDTATTQTLDNILVCLDDIQTIASRIATVDSSIYTTLSSIYTAVQNVEGDLQNTNSYLSLIRTNLNTISSTCDQILSASNQTNTILTNTQTYLQTHLPLIEGDLNTINNSINNFRVDFGNFAVDCLAALNSIDSTTQHIDETLDEIMDYYNGTALQNVPVTTSGGSSMNLWSLIKNSVTTTLSGIGGFFSGLFDFIGLFSSSATGFNTFLTIDSYSPVTYVPTDFMLSGANVIPDQTFNYWDTNYRYNIKCSGTTITAYANVSSGSGYSRSILSGLQLEPGQYMLYAPNSGGDFDIILRVGNANFGSWVSDLNYPFTVNNTTTFGILLRFPSGTLNFSKSFELKVVKTG